MPGTGGLGLYTTSFWFQEDEQSLFITGYFASSTGSMTKLFWNASSSTWVTAAGYPKTGEFTYTAQNGASVTCYGIRGVVGGRRDSDGSLVL